MRLALGLLLAFLLGVATRLFRLPVPAPPSLLGATLVVAVTTGYLLAEHLEERVLRCGHPDLPDISDWKEPHGR